MHVILEHDCALSVEVRGMLARVLRRDLMPVLRCVVEESGGEVQGLGTGSSARSVSARVPTIEGVARAVEQIPRAFGATRERVREKFSVDSRPV